LTDIPQTGVSTPTGTSLLVYPSDAPDIPDDGSYFLFGPDLQKDLLDSVQKDCESESDPNCPDRLKRSLGNGNADLVSRAIRWPPSYRKGVLWGVISILIMKWKGPGGAQPPPLNIHVPSSALSQINALSSATKVVFKTADNDPSPVTVQITTDSDSTPSPTGGPLSIAAADGSNHKKGDIEIDAPSDEIANALNNIIKKGKCEAPQSGAQLAKRIDTAEVDCYVSDFQELLNQMQGNGPLHDYGQQAMQVAPDFPLPNLQDPNQAAAFGQIVAVAANRVPQAIQRIPQNSVLRATIFLFWIQVARHAQILMQNRRIFLPGNLVNNQPFKLVCPAKGTDYYPQCDSFLCAGQNGQCTSIAMKPGGCDNCPSDVDQLVS